MENSLLTQNRIMFNFFRNCEKEDWKDRREDFNAFRVFNPGMISKKRISRAWLHEAHKLHRAQNFWK